MLFSWDVEVPANTLETAPVVQELKLTAGTIILISIAFRAGCHNLVRVQILHEESSLVPLNKGVWLTGDDEVVHAWMWYPLAPATNWLKFRAYSTGTSYAHTITVRVSELPPELAAFVKGISWLNKIAERLGLA